MNLSPRYGFTLFLLEGGAEIRLGRKDYDRKLARLDQIFEAVADPALVRVVHLDGSDLRRVPVRLQVSNLTTAVEPSPPAQRDHLANVSE